MKWVVRSLDDLHPDIHLPPDEVIDIRILLHIYETSKVSDLTLLSVSSRFNVEFLSVKVN